MRYGASGFKAKCKGRSREANGGNSDPPGGRGVPELTEVLRCVAEYGVEPEDLRERGFDNWNSGSAGSTGVNQDVAIDKIMSLGHGQSQLS